VSEYFAVATQLDCLVCGPDPPQEGQHYLMPLHRNRRATVRCRTDSALDAPSYRANHRLHRTEAVIASLGHIDDFPHSLSEIRFPIFQIIWGFPASDTIWNP
jgi:hypothetical protein